MTTPINPHDAVIQAINHYDRIIKATKEDLIKQKSNSSRPKYYQLKEGWLASVAAYCEKPQELINVYKEKGWLLDRIRIAALTLPALVGKSISSVIHFVNGEKIRRADYDRCYQEWMQKDYIGRVPADLKKFVDTCIKNKIQPNQCPYQIIADYPLIHRMSLHMFSIDGRVYDLDKVVREKGINMLMLMVPKAKSKESNCTAFELKKDWANRIATYEPTGTEDGDEERKRTVEERCQFVMFNTRSSGLNKHLIEDITQKPQA